MSNRLAELTLSEDHLSINIKGVWIELPQKIESLNIIAKKECKVCARDTLENCICSPDRNLFCETFGASQGKIDFDEVY